MAGIEAKLSARLVADVADILFAYREGDLLIVLLAEGASEQVYEPVRQESPCRTVVYSGENYRFAEGDPEWSRAAGLTVFKAWDGCPPYEHDVCAEEVSRVAS